jgi:hypothetical protein
MYTKDNKMSALLIVDKKVRNARIFLTLRSGEMCHMILSHVRLSSQTTDYSTRPLSVGNHRQRIFVKNIK